MKFSPTGQRLATYGGTHGAGNGEFEFPSDVAFDASGNIYVADSGNNRIQKFSATWQYITQWGSEGAGDSQFEYAPRLAVRGGFVYVVDLHFDDNGGTIKKFTEDGTFVTKWNPLKSNGPFANPQAVAVDSENHVYVTTNDGDEEFRVRKFTSDGTFITEWGRYGEGIGEFYAPFGIAVDAHDRVYVADSWNSRIQVFTSTGTFITAFGREGEDPGEIYSAYDVAVDAAGNVYVADDIVLWISKFAPSRAALRDGPSSDNRSRKNSARDGQKADKNGRANHDRREKSDHKRRRRRIGRRRGNHGYRGAWHASRRNPGHAELGKRM
jgi:DNA-binding beta-propeller fold protein YncE